MKKTRKLSANQKNWLVALHSLCMVAWLGGTACMFALTLVAATAADRTVMTVTYANLNHLDDLFIKYPALATLLTGLCLSLWTNWGLFTYYWLIVKELLTVAVIGFGIFGMNHWLDTVTAAAIRNGMAAFQAPGAAFARTMLWRGALLNLLLLVFMVVISYVKPWGKRKAQPLFAQRTTH